MYIIQVTQEVVKFIKPSVLLISLFLLYLYLVPVIECGVYTHNSLQGTRDIHRDLRSALNALETLKVLCACIIGPFGRDYSHSPLPLTAALIAGAAILRIGPADEMPAVSVGGECSNRHLGSSF